MKRFSQRCPPPTGPCWQICCHKRGGDCWPATSRHALSFTVTSPPAPSRDRRPKLATSPASVICRKPLFSFSYMGVWLLHITKVNFLVPLPIRVVNNVIESPSLFAQTTQTVTFLLIWERGQNYRNSVPTMQWGAGVVICPKRLCFNIFVIHIGILIFPIPSQCYASGCWVRRK